MDMITKEVAFAVAFVILLSILLVPVSALTQKVIITLNQGVVINGKNITFVGSSGDAANIKVDGALGTVKKGDQTTIGGVIIALLGISSQPSSAILNITVHFVCGDGNCDTSQGEGPSVCCMDCGCLGRKACFSNICLENLTSPSACHTDADCTPSTVCAIAACDASVVPSQCVEEQITSCVSGDQCCPASCTTESDSDCEAVPTCESAKDCDDANPCTEDICTGNPRGCTYRTEQGCAEGNICVSVGEFKDIEYCTSSGKWELLKPESSLCQNSYECLTQRCSDKKCVEEKTSSTYLYGLIIIFIILVGVIVYYFYLVKKKSHEEGVATTPSQLSKGRR